MCIAYQVHNYKKSVVKEPCSLVSKRICSVSSFEKPGCKFGEKSLEYFGEKSLGVFHDMNLSRRAMVCWKASAIEIPTFY